MVTLRWEQKLDSFTKALNRLAEVVNESKKRELNGFELDSVVQRFEFTHEIAWKLMLSYCKFVSPEEQTLGSKDSTRWAFRAGLIENGEVWMDMINARNTTSHTYDGEVAETIISKIVEVYFPEMVKFHNKMESLKANEDLCLFLND